MGSHYGTCEIVEVEDEPKSSDYSKKTIDKGKKPQGHCTTSIEDDINKLFQAINVRTSFHGLTLNESGATTPRRNPSKKPMRMSTSSSTSGYPEPVSLKQSLRRLCISQASEMAAMKRSLKPPVSPALSDTGKSLLATMNRSSKPPSPALSDAGKPEMAAVRRPIKSPESTALSSSTKLPNAYTSNKDSQESTSSSSRKMHLEQQASKIKSKNNLSQSFLQSTTKKPTKEVETTLRLNKILREPELGNGSKPTNKPLNKPALKLRRKGKLKKLIVKKKSPSVHEPSHAVCQKCQCTLTEPNGSNHASTQTGTVPSSSVLYNPNSKHGDKSEFTQSSNSSIGEYSSSTSISEDSTMSRCSMNNKPHMSTDAKWQAINRVMKQNGYLGLRNFNLLKKLGCGDIGTVYLAELVGSSCLFAIKVMDNEFLERRKKMPRAHTEREILRILDHPFLPTLYAHFVSENLSCLVMEYCPGGDLHVLRQKQPDRYYHEQAARFYVAEVLLALEYLHMLGIVYRDLKPENILVREDGHIMLTDFDLSLRCTVSPTLLQSPTSGPMDPPRVSGPCAGSNCIDPFCLKPTCQISCFTPRHRRPHKPNKPDPKTRHESYPQLVAEPTEARSNSFVGTHEYLAPEIIKGDGHGSAVDWWTLGVFLFELLYGRTPFKGLGNDETMANVVLETLKFPDTPIVSFQARDLIKGLLVKSPENRLGSERGAAEVRRHPFFDGLNWALIRCAVPPEVPEGCDIGVGGKAKKYLERNGDLEFEIF